MYLKQILGFALIAIPLKEVAAQSCDGYAAMNKGTKYQLTSYDKGNMSKVTSTSDYEVISSSGNKATSHITTTDAKGKTTVNTDFDITCQGNSVVIDQKSILSTEMASSSSSSDVNTEVSGTNPEIPNDLSIGQSLPDSKIDLLISAGTVKMNAGVEVINRKVTGKESVTVPAGTFDCFVISDESTAKTLVTKKTTRKIWIAKGVGTVKMEMFDKKGKLDKLQLLTSFQK